MNPRVEAYRSHLGKQIDFDYPILKYLGLIALEVDEGYIKAEMKARRELLNPVGFLHGGIMAMVMDELMGAAGWTLNRPDHFVTLNLNIDFLSGAREDDILLAEGKIVRPGNNVLHAESKIFHSSGKLLAKATCNLIRVA
jgi:acyl-coenzyme A thioesterase 13